MHGCDALHAEVHWCVAASQAFPVGQSAAALQPQLPAMHVCPTGLLLQSAHTSDVPHDDAAVPAVHVPSDCPAAMLQHPPLHDWVALHVVVQVLVAASHA